MKDMHKLKEMLCEELDDYVEKGKLSPSDIDIIYKLASSIKNINKNEMYEEGGHSERRGYSRDGEWMARGEYDSSYEGGSSRARRRDSRGRYSRDGGSYEGGGSSYRGGSSYEGGSSSQRGQSRAEGKDEMLQMIDEMMSQAETEKEREALHRCRMELSRA